MTSLCALVCALSSFVLPAVAQLPSNYTNAFKQVSLSAPDGSIKASFMQLGATITHLLVRDRHGAFRDVVLGYDNTVSTEPLVKQHVAELFSPGCVLFVEYRRSI